MDKTSLPLQTVRLSPWLRGGVVADKGEGVCGSGKPEDHGIFEGFQEKIVFQQRHDHLISAGYVPLRPPLGDVDGGYI